MDYEGCYVDPERAAASNAASSTNVDGEDGIDNEGGMMMNNMDDDDTNNPTKKQTQSTSHVIPPLHPDDEAIINWKGSYGDTSAEQLQQKRDRARAAARLAIAQGYGSLSAAAMATPSSSSRLGGGKKSLSSSAATGSTVMKLKKKHHLQSRILDEKTPNFMKKTTYLTNDATSVHRFTSLASTQEKRAREVDKALAETSLRYKREDVIERGFVEANSWDVMMVNSNNGGGVEVEEGRKKKRRVHPSKKGVYPVWDLPLLPDVPTWGHTYAHVVLDHPPKSVGTAPASGGGASSATTPSKNKNLVTARQLQKAIVADVSKQTQNSRMACTVWVPDTDDSTSTNNEKENEEGEKNEETTKNVKKKGEEKGETYQAVQRYDLDVLPLRDPSGPQVHYVWMVDPSKKYVGYHPVGSRVQLSTGRPIIQAGGNNNKTQRHGGGGGGGGENEKVVTNESIIFRRAIEVDERKEMEKRMAEVDVDMAEKYGLVEDNELLEGGGGKKEGGGDGLEGKNNVDDGNDEEMEKDAF